ncbi:MAG: precorrin-6A/cobalt-precorrin-6A reductase, partial [Kiloniellales bacterium]
MNRRNRRLLLLAGTAEARTLAERLAERKDMETIVSLAGATRAPARYPGQVRSGGFGGAAGLARYLKSERIDLLVDATHPYAATMSDNAATAAERAEIPRLLYARPAWQKQAGDKWLEVADAAEAARALGDLGKRV